jgi:TPR repeat protein
MSGENLHADTIMTSFASVPASRYRSICLALLLVAAAMSPARAGDDTYEAYEAALSYRNAVHGSADAQADLGARYAEGRGLPYSDERAVHWLTRAAEQGHAGAELKLSEFHAAGRGTAKSEVTAYKWAFLSAVHSVSGPAHESALAMLDTLTRRMSEQQLSEARRLVDEPQSASAVTDDTASPSDGEPDSGHRVSKLHRAGSSRANRATRVHLRHSHSARSWGY